MPTQFRGGLRIGRSYWIARNYTYPLVTLTVSADALLVECLFLGYRLPRTDVISISEYRTLFSRGLRIEHQTRDEEVAPIPPFLVFWTRRTRDVSAALTDLGYPATLGAMRRCNPNSR